MKDNEMLKPEYEKFFSKEHSDKVHEVPVEDSRSLDEKLDDLINQFNSKL